MEGEAEGDEGKGEEEGEGKGEREGEDGGAMAFRVRCAWRWKRRGSRAIWNHSCSIASIHSSAALAVTANHAHDG